MPDINLWMGDTFALGDWTDDVDKAHDIARVIAEKTTSITVQRGAGSLSAQNVRIETMERGERTVTVNGRQHQVDAIVYGYASHPTITATDLQPGDRFVAAGERYEVMVLLVGLTDMLQAFCEVLT